jgi:hypothetical protein
MMGSIFMICNFYGHFIMSIMCLELVDQQIEANYEARFMRLIANLGVAQ